MHEFKSSSQVRGAVGPEPLREGATILAAEGQNADKPLGAPGARVKGQPFFNPGMALNRDLSILLVEAFARRKGREIDVADVLAGTGARSVRLACEVASPIIVHANDADPNAVAAMRVAGTANGMGADRLQVTQSDAHAFLGTRRFDIVDLDPCGSPAPFLDAAMRSVRHGGLVCATATDTGALAGKFPRVARRRYDAHHGLHAMAWRSEVGLRILAGAMVRSAARLERAARPVLSISRGHWMRVVCAVGDGASDADEALKQLVAAVPTDTGSGRFLGRHDRAAEDAAWAGPLWSGPLHDASVVEGMGAAREGKVLGQPGAVDDLLPVLAAEADAPPFWVSPNDLQAQLGPQPRRDDLITRLVAAGWHAARTHMDPQGVRTDADGAALAAAWGKARPAGPRQP